MVTSLRLFKLALSEMVPVVVMVPPLRPVPAVTEVTVPPPIATVAFRHTPELLSYCSTCKSSGVSMATSCKICRVGCPIRNAFRVLSNITNLLSVLGSAATYPLLNTSTDP